MAICTTCGNDSVTCPDKVKPCCRGFNEGRISPLFSGKRFQYHIPQHFDDSMSYYQFLSRVANKLNEVICKMNTEMITREEIMDKVREILLQWLEDGMLGPELRDIFEELLSRVNSLNYFVIDASIENDIHGIIYPPLIPNDSSNETAIENQIRLNNLLEATTWRPPGADGCVGINVYIPPGQYYINGPIVLQQHNLLTGTRGSDVNIVFATQQTTIRGLTTEGGPTSERPNIMAGLLCLGPRSRVEGLDVTSVGGNGVAVVHNPDGLSNWGSGSAIVADHHIENCRFRSFGDGALLSTRCWDNVFLGVRFDSCGRIMQMGSQANMYKFIQCRWSGLTGSVGINLINVENVIFDSCDIVGINWQNGPEYLMGQVFQSYVVFNDCYIEHIRNIGPISTFSESANNPSSFIMRGGAWLGTPQDQIRLYSAGSVCNYLEISGMIRAPEILLDTTSIAAGSAPSVFRGDSSVKQGPNIGFNADFILNEHIPLYTNNGSTTLIDANAFAIRFPGDTWTETNGTYKGRTIREITLAASNGIQIGPNLLNLIASAGESYTLTIMIKVVSGNAAFHNNVETARSLIATNGFVAYQVCDTSQRSIGILASGGPATIQIAFVGVFSGLSLSDKLWLAFS